MGKAIKWHERSPHQFMLSTPSIVEFAAAAHSHLLMHLHLQQPVSFTHIICNDQASSAIIEIKWSNIKYIPLQHIRDNEIM
jgi:hypothetical protein